MTFKELRTASGMKQQDFADYFGIPKRTIENWEAGVNKCPEYLLDLMKYKLIHETKISVQWEIFEDGGLIQYRCPVCKIIYVYLKRENKAAPCQCEWCGAKMDK